ncbi:hypothetical protein CPB83DRAFT_872051 [Crepidotus variabilis]|uniref:RING-type domain-containing protein n=1 Tax=Crepidotus variabilis TaxID=179855 RepID=A0A9P6E4A1_9AGAR|nr:hypothetical protein CPB83DRAFT_872051 [Crepidotus variabilis]
MTKHSKNNTASSIFSYAEYKKLDYGTKRQRLGNESMRRFDACALCLNRAREPLACTEGHLFCKECVYTDLLTQKKDIKRQKDRLDALKKEAEVEQAKAREAARERVLREFEKGQLGLASGTVGSRIVEKKANEPRGTKRKTPPPLEPSTPSEAFSFSSKAVHDLADKAEEAALKQIESELTESLKAKLPDFWLPSLTPTHASNALPQNLAEIDAGVRKLQTVCRAGQESHAVALKNLVRVNFTMYSSSSNPSGSGTSEGASKKEDSEAMCPSCKKNLSNSSLMFLSKPCGHVTCKTCTDTLVRPSKQCIVCDTKLKEKEIIELKREGTGFAGGGLAETSKTGIAFQG